MFTFSKNSLLLGSVLLAATTLVQAEERAIKEYSFPLTDIERIDFVGAVGSMRLSTAAGDQVRVVLEIKQSDKGWFDREVDLDEVELESRLSNGRLVLKQTDDDLNIEWTIELPAVAATHIKLGVGQIEGELAATELRVDLGVGEVDLTLPQQSIGDVDLHTGVGDVRLRGAESVDRSQHMVSATVTGHGAGANEVNVDVGVGEAKIALVD